MWRHDLKTVAAGLIVGPALATLVYWVLFVLIDTGPIGLVLLDWRVVFGSIPFGYLIVGLPSLGMGIGNAVVARLVRPETFRLLLALPVGAVPFMVGAGWLATEELAGGLGLIALTGALVSLVCVALVESFGGPVARRA